VNDTRILVVDHNDPSVCRARQKPSLGLQVEVLPPKPDDPEFVKSLNERPGILALAMKRKTGRDGKLTFEGIPFVVPGARFNEVSTDDRIGV
jgi:alpha,alpha-trehalase